MAQAQTRKLETISELTFFFDSANRDNQEKQSNLNQPHKLIPSSLYPDHDVDAVRLSLNSISIPKTMYALRVPGRNRLYIQNSNGEEYILTIDQTKAYSNHELAVLIDTAPELDNMPQGPYPPGYEKLDCEYDKDNLTFTFSISKTNQWVSGDLAGYWRFDLSDYNGDSCHEYLGFPNQSDARPEDRYSAWMSYDPGFLPLPAGVTNPVASVIVTPMSEFPSSYYLRTSFPGNNIDCAVARDSRNRNSSNVEARRSRILAHVNDANVEPEQCINFVAAYPHQFSTTMYTKQVPDRLNFSLTDLEGNLACFRRNWVASFTMEFLQYAK